MSININLVDQRNPSIAKSDKLQKIKATSYAVLFLTGFLAILIFALDYRFSASYVKKQQAELINQLSSFSDVSAKIYIVNSKLSEISNILDSRKKYGAITSDIMRAAGPDLSVDEFLFNESSMSIKASATSLTTIDTFLNSLLEMVNKKEIPGIVIESLSLQEGKYVLILSIK